MNGVDEVIWKSEMLPQKQMIIFTYEALNKHRTKGKTPENFIKRFQDKGYVVGLMYEPKDLKKCAAIARKAKLDCFEQAPVSAHYAFNCKDMVLAQDIRLTQTSFVVDDPKTVDIVESFGMRIIKDPRSLLQVKENLQPVALLEEQPEYNNVIALKVA